MLARAKDRSISSCVRFFDFKNSILFSRGAEATDGSWRKFTAEATRSSRGAMAALRHRSNSAYRIGTETAGIWTCVTERRATSSYHSDENA